MQWFQVKTQVSDTVFERGTSPAVVWSCNSATGSVELQVPWETHMWGEACVSRQWFQKGEDHHLPISLP